MIDRGKALREALEWKEAHGGARSLAREAQEFRLILEWFYAHREELVRIYPDQWIGLYQDRAVVASDLEELNGSMEKSGFPKSQALVAFLNTEGEEWTPNLLSGFFNA
ncbi:MAG: hypothetical protein HY681_08955 [Chloroflexi bacterium]|nr:hypothetical protein [Chloroflexota bacterium]